MSWPQPYFSPLIPTQIECFNKQLLLLLMVIGYVNYYLNWHNEAIWKTGSCRATKDLLLCEISF